jgi:hypothetical protein
LHSAAARSNPRAFKTQVLWRMPPGLFQWRLEPALIGPFSPQLGNFRQTARVSCLARFAQCVWAEPKFRGWASVIEEHYYD